MIRPCPTCVPHTYQDTHYGPKLRVKNYCDDGYRCTVCGDVEKVDHKTSPTPANPSKGGVRAIGCTK